MPSRRALLACHVLALKLLLTIAFGLQGRPQAAFAAATPTATLSVPPPEGTYGERTGSSTPSYKIDVDSASAAITSLTSTPTKTIVATSEAHTGVPSGSSNERVAIGEVVRYRLQVPVAEGSSPSLMMRDDLPVQLRFINDGTARAMFVANGAGFSSSTLSGPGLNQTGNESTQGLTPSAALADPAVSTSASSNSDTYNNGTDIYFKLGNVTNNDSDADQELVVVEFNALVVNRINNEAFNNATGAANLTQVPNYFEVLVNSSPVGTSPTITARIAEPVIHSIVKTITSAPRDAGDTVTYSLVFANSAVGADSAAAFDVVLSDTLNANLIPQSVTGVISGGSGTCGSVVPAFVGVISGQTVTGLVNCLLPNNGTVTITITARVTDGTAAGQTIPNAASLIYSSLPNSGTTGNPTGSNTVGAAGSATGERNGSSGSGGLNDYVAVGNVSTTLGTPRIVKFTPSAARHTIGDLVTYDLTVTLPEGVTQSLMITDDLPVGLDYVSHQISTTAAASDGALTADFNGTLPTPMFTMPNGSDSDLTLTFGDTTTVADNVMTNNTFAIRVTARVLDSASNQQGSVLGNTGRLRYTDPNSNLVAESETGIVNITLIEPQITTAKSVAPSSGVQSGDTVRYTVRLTNTGSSTAFDVIAQDDLPWGVELVDDSITCMDDSGAMPAARMYGDGRVYIESEPGGAWDIPPGGFIECSYEAIATDDLPIDGAHTNTVDADWSSLNGTISGERRYTDLPGVTVDGAQDSASATFTSAAPTFSKSDGGTTSATIGQTINYTLRIESPLGTVRDLVIVDTLPAGLIFETGSAVVSGFDPLVDVRVSGSNDGYAPVGLTWDVGDGIMTQNSATITFRAVVANVMDNVEGVSLTNSATLSYTAAADTPKTLAVSDGLALVEPSLTIDKEVSRASAAVGDEVVYTLTVANDDAETAYDVEVIDVLPTGLGYVPGSIAIESSPAGNTDDSAGPTLRWTFASIAPHETATLTFKARVQSLIAGGVINNTADVTWTSTPGTNGDERTGTGDQNSYVASDTTRLALATFEISKTLIDPAAGPAAVNDAIRFEIAIANTGASVLTVVPLTDTYNANYLRYVGASQPPDDIADDGEIAWANVGPIEPGATQTITVDFVAVAATVGGGSTTSVATAAGVTDSNEAAVGEASDDATVTIATPDLAITKTDGATSVAPGDVAAYTLAYRNNGAVAASGVVIGETVPDHATFNAAASTAGWNCAAGGAAGDTCTVAIGTVASGGSGSVQFAITIDAVIPNEVRWIANTATIGDDGSHGPDANDANNSSSDIDALAVGSLGDRVWFDADNDGIEDAGEPGLPGIAIKATRAEQDGVFGTADDVVWMTATGADGSYSFADLPPGSYLVAVDQGTLPAGVTPGSDFDGTADHVTQVTVEPGKDRDDVDFGYIGGYGPDLILTIDDGGVFAVPDGVIAYRLSYSNVGSASASGVVINETVPTNTIFNAAQSDAGWSCAGAGAAGSVCTYNVGNVQTGGSGNVRFAVTVAATIPNGVTQIASSATITDDATHGSDLTPANNAATATTPFEPTAVTLKSFSGQRADEGVVVRGETALEHYTAGFRLYRSTDRTRTHAEQITPVLIAATGNGMGASYSYTDDSAVAGTLYYYWLIEIEDAAVGGNATEYGPVAVYPYTVHLPIVRQ